MKKILFFAAAMIFLGFAANAQNANNEPAIMTNKSVGSLVIGQKMPQAVPDGAFYDKVVREEEKSPWGSTSVEYHLYKNNKEIGEVSTFSDDEIKSISITGPCNVQLENGIKIGMSFKEALEKSGVIATATSINGTDFYLEISYNGVGFFGTDNMEAHTTKQGKARIRKELKKHDGESIPVKASDMKNTLKVISMFANGIDR